MTPSPRQQAIYDAACAGTNHLVIQACAGSGKTTTLVGVCERLPPEVRILALAFNKSIADELQKRMPRNVRCATLHGIGYSAVKRMVRSAELDDNKLRKIICKLPEVMGNVAGGAILQDLLMTVPLIQEMKIDPSDHRGMWAAIEQAGRTPELGEDILPLIHPVMAASDEDREAISFTDMIRHPVIHDYPCDQYQVVLVDEAQDLNALQHELIQRVLVPGGMLVACGDVAQSIYGFRGADVRSMERLKEFWKAIELPLDISYRCPTSVVALAQEIVGDLIQPAPSAQAGNVAHRSVEQYQTTLESMRDGDMALCRTNAPLVSAAFRLIRAGKKAIIRGRDLGSGLCLLVQRLGSTSIKALVADVIQWRKVEIGKARNRGKSPHLVIDKADTLLAIASECAEVAEVSAKIRDIFSEQVQGIVLSTVHRAKGLEANTVVILGPEMMPAKWAKSDEEKQQERNIQYVAYTRAKETLILQSLPGRPKEQDHDDEDEED